MADVEMITDAAAALDRCGDLFRADPIGCNVVATGVLPQADVQIVRVHDGADTSGVALIEGDTCVLSVAAGTSGVEVARAVAPMVGSERSIEISGPAGAVAELAGLLSERVDGAIVDPRLARVYRAESVDEPSKRRRGKAFVTERERIDEASAWSVGFARDTGQSRTPEAATEQMTRAVNESRLVEWRSKGEVVSQLLVSAARFGVVRISQVYTPPEFRKLGHGGAFVAAVARQQLERQKVDTVVVHAPASNGATNRMYRGLGFVHAHEQLTVRVVPR